MFFSYFGVHSLVNYPSFIMAHINAIIWFLAELNSLIFPDPILSLRIHIK